MYFDEIWHCCTTKCWLRLGELLICGGLILIRFSFCSPYTLWYIGRRRAMLEVTARSLLNGQEPVDLQQTTSSDLWPRSQLKSWSGYVPRKWHCFLSVLLWQDVSWYYGWDPLLPVTPDLLVLALYTYIAGGMSKCLWLCHLRLPPTYTHKSHFFNSGYSHTPSIPGPHTSSPSMGFPRPL